MSNIRKNNPKYILWKKRNDEKRLRNRIKKTGKKVKRKEISEEKKNIAHSKEFYIPQVFSIIKNPEETIKFLNGMIDDVEKVRKKYLNKDKNVKTFYLKMKNTIEITGDALMYLLTIIKNTRGDKFVPINWVGDFPKDEKNKKFLQNSGYLKYMKTAKENLLQTNDHIQIKNGQGYEYKSDGKIIDIRQEIIDFTCEKLKKDKTQINFLMTMLIEMITNIKDHAYDRESLFEHNWYIFVENSDDKILYTFMDNGLGIPTTIKKSNFELIKEKLLLDKEYKYIEAGVSGIEKRSKTGLLERGNGLPSIYEQYTSNKIDNLVIISNKAYYKKECPRDLENNLNGTIFYWEINKEESI